MICETCGGKAARVTRVSAAVEPYRAAEGTLLASPLQTDGPAVDKIVCVECVRFADRCICARGVPPKLEKWGIAA